MKYWTQFPETENFKSKKYSSGGKWKDEEGKAKAKLL